MNISKYFLISNFLIAALITSFAFLEKGLWVGIVITLIWLILWWISQSSASNFMPSIFFVGFILICLAGSFWGLRPSLPFLGVIAALNAWDSDRFYRRWKDVEDNQSMRNIERNHLVRILAVDGMAIILAAIGLSLKAQLNFGIILLCGFLAVISLSRLISLLRNHSQRS